VRTLTLSLAAALLAVPLAAWPGAARAGTIRDLAEVKGAQEQQLYGVGLVVGLRGTGDKTAETRKRIAQLLANGFRFTAKAEDLTTKNIALVLVTARVRPFLKQGQRLDVTVSSIGDASSLENGTLIPTPLHASDPDVQYVRAEGLVSVKAADGAVLSPTSGTVSGGGILEREVPAPPLEVVGTGADGRRVEYIELILRQSDFRLAREVADSVNTFLRVPQEAPAARALDAALVRVEIPSAYAANKVGFIEEITNLPVAYEPPATVRINERTGVVVITGAVKVNKAAISVGNIQMKVEEDGALLVDLQATTRKLAYSNSELIAIIKELDRAKALQARLICE